ncbi:MFS general substrate transporter [Suhomyces tanzawaensis NRRL Y-17324]|uniref:MFS general substrate transporter n=1 Tax=Suhomyces tanzawaensis NRRL Y-17324 TaxID=984487 RepID=A0A1E4SCX9_9ASCO|nr:MFS general substrate transporter [Suhomyces tanzawaensis NRRL Y-17324]ODV77374.1 MFS general substrate transporter [Suhomyces tanzawaensis NRRL Y-17324]
MSSTNTLSFKQQMRGFPVWQMTVICLVRFSEPITFSSFFPYIYFMVRDFGIAKDEADIARYSGFLAASFAICQFLVCVKWAGVSDRYGRKVVIICGMAGTTVSALLFGFSTSYWFAMGARCFMGLSNGNVAVIRTIIGEIATERRHQALAFSCLPLIWSVGTIVGPMIGGSKYLTRPREVALQPMITNLLDQVLVGNSFYEKFITKYPYALSNVVVAIFSFLSLICTILFMEESHMKLKNRRDYGIDLGDKIRAFFGFKVPVRPWNRSFRKVTEHTPLIQKTSSYQEETIEENDNDSIASFEYEQSNAAGGSIVRRYSNSDELSRVNRPALSRSNTGDTVKNSYAEIFTPAVIQAITANLLTALHNIVYSEFLPVLLARKLLVDDLDFPFKIKGGFGFELSDIGTLLSVTGLMGTLAIVFIFPYLDRNFKTIHTYRTASSFFPFIYIILPYLIFTLHEYNPIFPQGLTKIFLYILACINSTCSAITFPNITMLIHRAAPPDHRSFINGLALSGSSFARFVGPVLWGYIISESEKVGRAQLSWVFLAGIAVICLVQAFVMEEHDEDLKDQAQTAARSTTSDVTV